MDGPRNWTKSGWFNIWKMNGRKRSKVDGPKNDYHNGKLNMSLTTNLPTGHQSSDEISNYSAVKIVSDF